MRQNVERRDGTTGPRFRARLKVGTKPIVGKWRLTRQEAERDRDVLRSRRDAMPSTVLTIAEAMAEVVKGLHDRDRRPATIKFYLDRFQMMRRLPPLASHRTLDQIDAAAIVEFTRLRRAAGVTWGTIYTDLSALKAIITIGQNCGLIRGSPIRQARLPPADRPAPRWFTPQELTVLLRRIRCYPDLPASATARDADVIELLALTGLRRREATDLRAEDVDLSRRLLTVRQGKRGPRQVHLGPAQLAVLRRLLDVHPAGPLLGLGVWGLAHLLAGWKRRLDEPRLHAHALRHTFATYVAKVSRNPYDVMAAAGIRSMKIAQRYTHLAGVSDGSVTESLSYDHGASGAARQAKTRPRKRRRGRRRRPVPAAPEPAPPPPAVPPGT